MNTKLTAIALSIAALSAQTPALAQSAVTLYGMVDGSINYTTNMNAAGASVAAVNSGSFLPSSWGIKGSEDLGGGNVAIFRLENSFSLDTGATATPTSFFNRFAYVGLSNDWGTLTIGRLGGVQYDYTVLGTYDLLYGATYGIYSLNADPIQIFKINNSIKYVSPSFAGVSGTVMYSFGQEQAGNNSAGRYEAAALEYVASTSFRTRVVYEKTNGSVAVTDQSSLTDTRLSVAARYDQGPFQLYADYVKVGGNLHISPAGNIYLGSIGYKISPAIRIVAQAGQYNFALGGKTRLAGLFASYNLSKQTTLYSFATRILNGATSNFGAAFTSTMAVPGQGQTALGVGMLKMF